jgi:hypothetical protein
MSRRASTGSGSCCGAGATTTSTPPVGSTPTHARSKRSISPNGEGNTTAARHTFFAFVYYLEPDFGGYDALIAVGAASIYGPLRR